MQEWTQAGASERVGKSWAYKDETEEGTIHRNGQLPFSTYHFSAHLSTPMINNIIKLLD